MTPCRNQRSGTVLRTPSRALPTARRFATPMSSSRLDVHRPRVQGLVHGARRLEPTGDERDVGDVELRGHEGTERARHRHVRLDASDGQVAVEPLARWLTDVL